MKVRWLWQAGKVALTLAILFFVGRQFYHDLNEPGLEDLPWTPGWLAFSGILYLGFLGILTCYWIWLLRLVGERPRLLTAFRAYYIGILGKYVPGKAWALLLRGGLVRGPNVRLGVAVITSFVEVFTTMAAGALVAGVGLLLFPSEIAEWDINPLWVAGALLVFCILPILPGIANPVARSMAAKFSQIEEYRLPPLRGSTLLGGLALTATGWGIVGIAVWAVLHAVMPLDLTWETWARVTTAMGLAYVAGFLAFIIPAGIGVREFFLLHLLSFAGPAQGVAAAVLLLRLVWTTAELIAAGSLYFVKPATES